MGGPTSWGILQNNYLRISNTVKNYLFGLFCSRSQFVAITPSLVLLLSGYFFVSEVALNVADTFGRGVALLLSPEQFGKSLVADTDTLHGGRHRHTTSFL